MSEAEQDRKALEDFIVNNPDLERLEALLDRFNIFEAIGMERQEIRHSRFLAFLLDPNESHGIGDAFVRRLLQHAVMDSPEASTPVTPIELSLWDLGGMSVQREWKHVDVFLLDERNRLAVIIENKIGAGEHSDQLSRYHKAVREQYPNYRILALYLTPGGEEPSHPEYLPVDYRAVCEILDGLAESRASVTEPDLRVLITHYTEMLRRHIVGDSEIARLSQQIYQKHQRAIDLIYEYRYAQQERIRDIASRLVRKTPSLVFNSRYTKYPEEYIAFWVKEWDVPSLQVADPNSWTGTERVLLLMFASHQDRLNLIMQIGPGDEVVRTKLLATASRNPIVFNDVPDTLNSFVTGIFKKPILNNTHYENVTDAEREAEIHKNWADFLENDLPRIDAALKQERWIWESSDDEIEDAPNRSERFGWGDGDNVEIKRPDEDPGQYEG